jgi:hypothetical protein
MDEFLTDMYFFTLCAYGAHIYEVDEVKIVGGMKIGAYFHKITQSIWEWVVTTKL